MRLRGPLGPLVVALAGVVALLAAPDVAHAERTLGLSTGTFEFSMAAGQEGQGDLLVLNDGDEPLRVLVYAANQIVSDDGEVTYQMPTRDDRNPIENPASWLNVRIPSSTETLGNIPVVDLAPGDRVPVEFSFTVPDGVPPGDHQILLFFEMLEEGQSLEGSGATVAGRLGARIRVRVQGDLVERIEVQPFSVREFVIGAKMPYVFLVRNGGNIDKIVNARLTLLDGSDAEVWASQPATDTTVFAGSNLERSGVVDLPVSLGKYTARLTVEYPREGSDSGVPEQIVEERTVWVVPLWLAIGVVVLIGGILLYGSWRQAVQAAERKARKERIAARAARRHAPEHEELVGIHLEDAGLLPDSDAEKPAE